MLARCATSSPFSMCAATPAPRVPNIFPDRPPRPLAHRARVLAVHQAPYERRLQITETDMASADTVVSGQSHGRHYNRWIQLAIGIACMGLVANLQYAWTLFVVPMDAKHHWGQAAIQTAFT